MAPCCYQITSRYACRHKERDVKTCWRSNFRKDFGCLSGIVSSCKPQKLSTNRLPCVCRKCSSYFVSEFGRDAARTVSRRFLEYKESTGTTNQAIDPRTIPHEVYITSAELARLGAKVTTRQPFRARSPMRATPPRTSSANGEGHRQRVQEGTRRDGGGRHLPAHIPLAHAQPAHVQPTHVQPAHVQPTHVQPAHVQPAQVQPANVQPPPLLSFRDRVRERRQTPYAHQPKQVYAYIYDLPSREVGPEDHSNARPAHPAFGHIVQSPETYTDTERADYVGGREPYNPSEHQPISHDRALTGTPLQPKPLRSNQFKDSSSDCSLVKRFTEVAKRSEVPGSPNPEPEELPRVPEIRAPPKVPSWRADTPPPIIVEDRARSLAPRLRDRVPLATPLRTAPATAPPPRTAGIRAPTGVYREQGVASASFAERVGRRGSQLVLFRTPSPTFSCAVQSCFCTAEDTDDRVCPSCCARRRLERDLQMQWI